MTRRNVINLAQLRHERENQHDTVSANRSRMRWDAEQHRIAVEEERNRAPGPAVWHPHSGAYAVNAAGQFVREPPTAGWSDLTRSQHHVITGPNNHHI